MPPETETFELIRCSPSCLVRPGTRTRFVDINDRWQSFAVDVRRSRVNNVLARIGGTGPPAIMAHADEICYVVKSITDDGFLHIWPYYMDTRGHPPRWIMPLNQPALIMTSGDSVEGTSRPPAATSSPIASLLRNGPGTTGR